MSINNFTQDPKLSIGKSKKFANELIFAENLQNLDEVLLIPIFL